MARLLRLFRHRCSAVRLTGSGPLRSHLPGSQLFGSQSLGNHLVRGGLVAGGLAVVAIASSTGCTCVPQTPTAYWRHPVIEMRERFEDIQDGICLEKGHDRTINDDFQQRANIAGDLASCAAINTRDYTVNTLKNTRRDIRCAVHGVRCEMRQAACHAANAAKQ